VRTAKELGVKSIGVTSNGVVLERHLPKLVDAGLTSVNISLDTLHKNKFQKLSRRDGGTLDRVLSAVHAAIKIGLQVKINCVLMKGVNDDELFSFVQLTKDLPLEVRFIEIMPFHGNGWDRNQVMSYTEALHRLEHADGVILPPDSGGAGGASSGLKEGAVPTTADPHDTTKWYRQEGHLGRVGFITTMSNPFCWGCNRVRITANLRLKACLFGDDETDLLAVMRSGRGDSEKEGDSNSNSSSSSSSSSKGRESALVQGIREAVQAKHFALGGHGDSAQLASQKNRSMIMIGG
jgi:cyclic pyranopterin phosphate synthase